MAKLEWEPQQQDCPRAGRLALTVEDSQIYQAGDRPVPLEVRARLRRPWCLSLQGLLEMHGVCLVPVSPYGAGVTSMCDYGAICVPGEAGASSLAPAALL